MNWNLHNSAVSPEGKWLNSSFFASESLRAPAHFFHSLSRKAVRESFGIAKWLLRGVNQPALHPEVRTWLLTAKGPVFET